MIYLKLNWYTKRLTLAAIYKSTEIFMIQDNSENFKDTIQFLDNRFNDLIYFNKFKSQVILV
jgi:ubiquinone biosynthesis protein COQ9